MRARLAFAAICLALTACGLDNEGDAPPRGVVYFPTALSLSAPRADGSARYLFVLNSNFDLRYNAGTVQAFDLDRIDEQIRERCQPGQACLDMCGDAARGCRADCRRRFPESSTDDDAAQDDAGVDDGMLAECFEGCENASDDCIDSCDYDGHCTIETTETAERNATAGEEPRRGSWRAPLADEVRVSSFATTIERATDGARLFVATRTTDHVTLLDLDEAASGDAVLDCADEGLWCNERSTRGDPDDGVRKPSWPGDPMDMLTGPLSELADGADDGTYLVVGHRDGSVSLFIQRGADGELELVHTLQVIFANSQITSLARDPESGLFFATFKQFTGSAKSLARVGVAVSDDDPRKWFLYGAGFVTLRGVAAQPDTRSIAFLDEPSGVDGSRALVVTQIPQALMWLNPDAPVGEVPEAQVHRVTEVGAGSTRVITGTVDGRRLAFVSCFDSREVFVLDVESGLPRSVVRNLSGPFDLALDEARQRLYVADFRTSVVRVIDIAPVTTQADDGTTTAYVAATLGELRVVQELQ